MSISKIEICLLQNIFICYHREYGEHPVSTDGGTWYPQAYQFLKLKHHIHIIMIKYYRNDNAIDFA